MLRILYAFLLILFFAHNTAAQKAFNNSIKLHRGSFFLSDRPVWLETKTRLIGLYYERRVYKNWFVGTGYSMWFWNHGSIGGAEVGEALGREDTARGTLWWRSNYKMADLYASYQLPIHRQHIVSAKLGLSYTWGTNAYTAGSNIALVYGRTMNYTGVVPQISYDYLFLKNRLCVGIDLRGRYYKGLTTQYDYGVHAGVNF